MFDQYAYLHFAVGIVFYFWGISFLNWFILHSIYEYVEITNVGTYIINTYFGKIWPGGGKHKAEPIINGVGDTLFAMFGWISAYYLDNVGKKHGWYDLHIKN
tara:strand:+ start:337 stop:642 length:306 start_codon:yes stop_codon:yes gene_type:complete